MSQSDFYQLFAYGHKYLNGTGGLFLVYPKTKAFAEVLPPFQFADGLTLWVVPFDLELDLLVASPGGLPVCSGYSAASSNAPAAVLVDEAVANGSARQRAGRRTLLGRAGTRAPVTSYQGS